MEKFESWFISLPVAEKEKVVNKAIKKFLPNFHVGGSDFIYYPECTIIWNKYLSDDERKWVHDHCTDKHGMLTPEWKEGCMFSE